MYRKHYNLNISINKCKENMKIETKYNIGDEVWVNWGYAKFGAITMIDITACDGAVIIQYSIDDCDSLDSENMVYATKQDLIDSL